MIEGAVSQLVMGMADDQATMSAAAVQNYILGAVRGLPPDFNQQLLARVRAVTVDDIKDAMRTWILPIFEPGKSNVVVCCAHVMTEVRIFPSFLLSFFFKKKEEKKRTASSLPSLSIRKGRCPDIRC